MAAVQLTFTHNSTPNTKNGTYITITKLNMHLKGASVQQHAPAALYRREIPGTHCTGGWVGPRVGLDGGKISSPPTTITSSYESNNMERPTVSSTTLTGSWLQFVDPPCLQCV